MHRAAEKILRTDASAPLINCRKGGNSAGSNVPVFHQTDYVMFLPIMLLTLFALRHLLIDLIVPPEWKWSNAVTALAGCVFAATAECKIRHSGALDSGTLQAVHVLACRHSALLMIDHFTIYFFYLFLAGAAISDSDVGALSGDRA